MLTIGSRGSQLALWQARWIEGRLEAFGERARIEIIKTTGDKITDVPLAKVGTKGLFTKEIEEALLDRRIDVAVHSLKDLPTEMPEGLVIAAVPERQDPCDALVGRKLADLPPGAKVGTSSLRRVAQIRALRPDIVIESVRGNVDTRLRKLDEGMYDAIVLAAAGLKRLGWESRIAEILPPEVMCPAVGQGALAVETRGDGGTGQQVCARLNHETTRIAVAAERALLGALGGGCQVPIGAYATCEGETLRLLGLVASPDGETVIRRQTVGTRSDAECLGRELGRELLAAGGSQILEAVYGFSLRDLKK
ncbi:MAG TPA: hydroxymethylbilane synthase [Bryobacteraceae bacterium]|nr:hydroxymethylbilane synthase [Bryobacteraceae bacterium]